jgi:hypothetical protein
VSGTLLQGILFVGLSTALTVAGLVIVRHYVPLPELEANHVVGLGIFAVLGTIYAVLLSFVVIAAWEQFGQARQVAEQEAGHVANLYWLAQELPDPGRHQSNREQDPQQAWEARLSVLQAGSPSRGELVQLRCWRQDGAGRRRVQLVDRAAARGLSWPLRIVTHSSSTTAWSY